MRATYVGTTYPHLRGKTALVRRLKGRPRGHVSAQFDAICYMADPREDGTPDWRLDLGWWVFPASDFVLIPTDEQTVLFHELLDSGRVYRYRAVFARATGHRVNRWVRGRRL